MKGFVVVLLLLLQCSCCVHSAGKQRFLTEIDRGANLASGVVDNVVSSSGFIVKASSENWRWQALNLRSSSSCDETYGFMPCTATVVGNLFLMALYGYLLYVSASLLSDGSELLLSVMGPGIIGGLFLPILGAFPDALLILGRARTLWKGQEGFKFERWTAPIMPTFLSVGRKLTYLSSEMTEISDGNRSQGNPVSGAVYGLVPSSGFIVKPSSESWPLRDLNLSSSSCEETYGFMPCTTTVVGNLLLMAVYGFLLFFSASLLSDGSELLLGVMGSGIIGGLFLPILGAFPDALLILVSGLSGSKETAQSQVLIGMGLLAGSTVMLLTALWGACTIVGKCDLSEEHAAIDGQDTRGFNLFGSGITTDKETSKASQIMMVSLVPFIIVQIPQVIHSSLAKRMGVLVGCIAAIICLLSYCIYQVIQPWIQKRRMAYAKHKHIVSAILNAIHSKGWGRLIREDGQPDDGVLESIFESLDGDHDGYLTINELRGLLVGLELHDPQTSTADAINKVMTEFDSSKDCKLSRDEFKVGMASWLRIGTSTVGRSKSNIYSKKFLSDFQSRTKEELDALKIGDEEEVIEVDNPRKIYLKAVMLMLGGAVIAAIFADPLVDAVDNFSDATSIPSFFISFIVMPFATNSSEGVSALIFASRKKKRTASLTYSEIYGAVTMNNTLCLGVFLAIIYLRGLDWDFSAEVLVIVLVVLVMGLLSSFRTTFPLWMSFIAFFFYPLTLAIVYVLDYVLGWS